MNTAIQPSWYEYINILEDINLTIDNIAKYLSPILLPIDVKEEQTSWNTELGYKLWLVLSKLKELDRTIKL